MAIEVEKKYRLRPEQVGPLRARLREAGGEGSGASVFEENVIYTGPGLDPGRRVLRLRRFADEGVRALFTFKERDLSGSPVRRQREEETEVADADALAAILEALGYSPALVYEKRRETWRLAGTEVVIDELPFGLFVEIEGEEADILKAEKLLGLEGDAGVQEPYPTLTLRHGVEKDGVVESRFRAETEEGRE